jgi:diguanylate cyclase (GGDEF)-like protein
MAHSKRNLLARASGARHRLGLLGRFAVLSVVSLTALGIALAHFVGAGIQKRALASSAQEAELITRFGITPQISGADLRQGLSPEAIDSLDQLLHAGYTSHPVEEIRIWNADGRIVYANEAELIGRRVADARPLRQALRGRTVARVARDDHWAPGERRGGQVIRVVAPLRYGGPDSAPAGAFEVHLAYAPVAGAIAADTHRVFVLLIAGLLLLWAVLFRIVQGASRRLRRQAAENEHQARHDALTGLLNRSSFYERVHAAIASVRGGHRVAVMIVDLDRFKEVNDTLGHHSGDLLLKQAGERLERALRSADVLARLGGDEFAVLLPDVESFEAASGTAARVGRALEEPFVLHGLTVHIEASTGVALYPDHGGDVELLMQRADVAMYAAKGSAASFELYAPEHDRHSPGRLALLGELRHALERDEFVLHYQPKASLRTGRVEGVEALVRWVHPERGLVPPDQFIPLAEQTGVIKPLTAWVVDEALRQCAEWRVRGLDLSVAVNLSVRNLLDAQLPESIAALLRRHEVPPPKLELEITEGTIVADQVRALDVLSRINAMGVGISIDDFGTGYSSLAYLKDLPVRELKIDRTFVNNMTEDGDDAFIVRSTIDLARNLGLEVVAEGVETEAVWDQLALLGCDVAQGYYLSRPVPAAALAEWLAERGDADMPGREGFAAGA